MQNYYAMERMIKEHNEHAWAIAELQALRRRAAAGRRAAILGAWRERFGHLSRRRSARRLVTE